MVVECARPGYGRRTLRSVPELEVMQDSLDDAGGVDEAHDLQRARATSAEQRIGFIYLLNQPCPCAPAAAGAAILSIGGGRRTGSRGAGFSRAGAADMGPLPIVPDELVSGIGDMRAQRGEKIECGTGKSAWRVSAGTAVMILGGIENQAAIGV